MPPKPAGVRVNPVSVQRWSTQTLILLSTSVGLSTYIIGFASGHKSGQEKAAALAALSPPTPPPGVTPPQPAPSSAPVSPVDAAFGSK